MEDDDEDDDFGHDIELPPDDEPVEELECPACGGSGGGPEHWMCSYCSGRGVVR